MTDLEFIDHWFDKCSDFIDPLLFRELRDRGLTSYVNLCGGSSIDENKAIARARMSKNGKYIGEPEIEKIASHIDKISSLKKKLCNTDETDVSNILKTLQELKFHTEYVRDYLK